MTALPTLKGFDYAPFLIPQENGTEFQLWEEVTYTASRGDSWTIPQGFRTDFATIPAAVSWAVPKLGAYTLAAIVHDLLCEGLNDWHRGWRYIDQETLRHERADRPTANAVDTDAIFYRIARDLGTDPVTAKLLWIGVRWGALANPARRGGWFQPKVMFPVLGWSLVYSPVLVPATVLAVVGRGLLAVIRRVAR